MSHKPIHLIRAIFHDPVSGNIHWREIESLLHHLGAELGVHGPGDGVGEIRVRGACEYLEVAVDGDPATRCHPVSLGSTNG